MSHAGLSVQVDPST